MSEDVTRNLPPRSFEERVLAELAAQREANNQLRDIVLQMNARLTALEDKVDARLRETRPIWEGVLERLTNIEARLSSIETEVANLRTRVAAVETRLEKVENQFELFTDKMEALNDSVLDISGKQRSLKRRMDKLESETVQ